MKNKKVLKALIIMIMNIKKKGSIQILKTILINQKALQIKNMQFYPNK